MSNMFKQAKEGVGSFFFVVWLVSALGMCGSGYIMYLDMMSTAYAYDMVPTREIDSVYAGSIFAILVWAAQIVGYYIYLSDDSKVWARQAAFVATIIDCGSDIYFKMGGHWSGWAMLGWSIVMTLGVFTLVSEGLFVVFAGFVIEGFSDFINIAVNIGNNILDTIFRAAVPSSEKSSGIRDFQSGQSIKEFRGSK